MGFVRVQGMAEVFLGGSKPLRFLSHFVLGVEFFSQKFGVILFFGGGDFSSKPFGNLASNFHGLLNPLRILFIPVAIGRAPEQLKIAKSFLEC